MDQAAMVPVIMVVMMAMPAMRAGRGRPGRDAPKGERHEGGEHQGSRHRQVISLPGRARSQGLREGGFMAALPVRASSIARLVLRDDVVSTGRDQ